MYEALEKQQHYQGSLQSISSKMEALEAKLGEPLEADQSPDGHIKALEVSRYSTVKFLNGSTQRERLHRRDGEGLLEVMTVVLPGSVGRDSVCAGGYKQAPDQLH